MRTILCLTLMILFFGNTVFAQTNIEKTISTKAGQKVHFEFDYPNIAINTWSKNQILVKGVAKINNGKNDDAFEIIVDENSGQLYIESNIKDKKNLPKMITVEKDGKRIYMDWDKDKKEMDYDDIRKSFGGEVNNINFGVIVEVELQITIPENIVLEMRSRFGDIDIKNFNGEMNIKNTHGHVEAIFEKMPSKNIRLCSTHDHVDVSIPANSKLDVELKSSHGDILTNIDLEFPNKNAEANSCRPNRVVAKMNGGGADLNLVATHDNVYLRKLQ